MGYEKFCEYFPFFIRAPSEREVEHCLCSKCYNAFKFTGFFKKVCGKDRVELAELPALAENVEFEDDKEEVKIQQMVKEDFGFNKKTGKPVKKWLNRVMNYDKLALIEKVSEIVEITSDHFKKLEADKTLFPALFDEALNKNFIVLHLDFAQNISNLFRKNVQQMKLSPIEKLLFCGKIQRFRW